MNFDPTDPYDAGAMLACFVLCGSCNAECEIDTDVPRSLEYYHRLGQATKSAGWYVAPEEGSDGEWYTFLCPSCAASAKLTPHPADYRCDPSEHVMVIASMVKTADD
jgi:hypothetical protein